MKKRIIFLLLFLVPLLGEEVISLSPYPWIKVHYEGEAVVFNKTCDKLSSTDPFYRMREDENNFIKVMEYVPNAKDGESYTILFSMGESADPQFHFYSEGNREQPRFIFYSDKLYFGGEGTLTVSSSTNRMFAQPRKYYLHKGKIREQAQQYFAIGIESIALRDLQIFADKKLRKLIDSVRKGEQVFVLAAEFKEKPELYLIRGERGLCGWLRIPHGIWMDESPIRNIYYNGD